MPKELERKLKARARKIGLPKHRQDAYVYGTLRKTGWKPGAQRKATARGHSARRGKAGRR